MMTLPPPPFRQPSGQRPQAADDGHISLIFGFCFRRCEARDGFQPTPITSTFEPVLYTRAAMIDADYMFLASRYLSIYMIIVQARKVLAASFHSSPRFLPLMPPPHRRQPFLLLADHFSSYQHHSCNNITINGHDYYYLIFGFLLH